ncbi:MAG TPA: PAS domain S-box protein, partial [Planctomycetaceae bacterium]|nr:PAS domain S-box protein [Planctomycetaceae bacterium]
MWGFLSRLFDTSGFPARWHCGTWSSGHGWLHILSDLGIWGAYLAIPCVLAYFASRKPDLPFRRIFWLFGAFILACGTTHLMEAVIFWWPAYRLAGVIKLLTALVSWATVLALIPATPRALALRTPQEFDRELSERRRAERELREMQADLERRVAERTAELTAANEALQSEINVRERFEEALASAREWFEVTLASIGDAVIVTDTEGRVTFLNQVARELTGRFDDVRGNPLDRIFCTVGDEAGSPAEDPAARVLGTGSTGTLTHRRLLMAADGTHRPIEDSVAPIRNAQGEVLGVVLVFRDVTERRRSEQAVRRSEERYRALVQATSQIVWTTDPDGQVVEDSPSWRTFTGQSYDQWKGAGWLNVVHPDDRARAADVWRRSVLSKSNYQVEYRLRSAAGEYRHMEARGVPVLDAEGKIVEWIGMNVDVTQQRQSAAALRDADRRKDQFLAMLGHELRNPLSGIAGAIQVLASIDSPNADAMEMRRIIERQTAHMSRLIDDLLEVSRISRGKIQLRPERVDLSELVRHTTDDLRPIFEAGRLDLNLELPEEPVFVSGDPTRLAQVLVNLLQNAAKFTNPGGHVGVTLSIDRARQSADVRVRDSGIGMTPETLAQIFEPFSQADISLERSRGGLGLGLALVQGLVE